MTDDTVINSELDVEDDGPESLDDAVLNHINVVPDLTLDLPKGARALVISDLHLGPVGTKQSRITCDQTFASTCSSTLTTQGAPTNIRASPATQPE